MGLFLKVNFQLLLLLVGAAVLFFGFVSLMFELSDRRRILSTRHLRFRRWRYTDARKLFQYASDPELGPRAGWRPHRSLNESKKIIREVFLNSHTWALELRGTDTLVGCMGYYTSGQSNLQIGENEAELGYWIAKPYWNQGFCTEALQAMTQWCFRKKGFTTLWGNYFIDNPASGRVLEKCGFQDTGETSLCPRLYEGNTRPVKIMRLDSSDQDRKEFNERVL